MGIHDGHRNRLRHRFLQDGLEGFQPHNVLELILFYCVPRRDTNEIAHKLLERFGTFHAVLEAPVEELCEIPGISYSGAVLLKTYLPVVKYYTRSKGDGAVFLNTSEACGDYAMELFKGDTLEKTVMFCLDNSCRLLSVAHIGDGDINSVSTSPRRILEAVINTGATLVVLAHNHPGGNAVPSLDDVKATIRIKNTLETVGAKMVDHLVVVHGDYVSMANSAMFTHIFEE